MQCQEETGLHKCLPINRQRTIEQNLSSIQFFDCSFGMMTISQLTLVMYVSFSWVEPLFCLGSKRSLDFDDLYACPSEAESRHLFNKFNKYLTYITSDDNHVLYIIGIGQENCNERK